MASSDEWSSTAVDRDDEENGYTPSQYSLSSAVSRFIYENGRTYHTYREGAYWGPNDDWNLTHESIIHHICLLTMKDRLFLAPIVREPKQILDIGTGSGLWAVDMADKYPNAKVTGIDLSPRPTDIPPQNVEFMTDDITSEWLWPENHFDLIHIRGLFGSIADWPELYAQIFRHLKPGGWLEQLEWSVHMKSDDGTLAPDAVLSQWSREAVEMGQRNGKTFEIAETMDVMIRDAGFDKIQKREYKWPIGTWSRDPAIKKIGYWNVKNWEVGMGGWSMALMTRLMRRTKEEVDERLQLLRVSLRDRRQHVYHNVPVVFAQKPG